MNSKRTDQSREPRTFVVTGHVRFVDDILALRTKVVAFDRDLRTEQPLGEAQTDRNGAYSIEYSERQFLNQERGTADLVVKAIDTDGSALVSSAVLFNAPAKAEIDLTIPLERKTPPSLFERIAAAVTPLLGKVKIEDLEEDQDHQDLTFLAGETEFDKPDLARFALAHRLAHHGIETEFWFVLLGGSFFEYVETLPLKAQQDTVTTALPSLDAGAVRKTLVRGFNRREIAARFRERVDKWIDAFLAVIGRLVLGDEKAPTFVRLALQHAGIDGADKQAKFARLFQQHRAVTPELLAALEKDRTFKKAEIADLRTSYQLADLTRGDFSVVRMLKEEFKLRRPEDIRTLAKRSTREWVDLVHRKHKAGEVTLPLGLKDPTDTVEVPEAELYAKMLERQFREAFPTAAFAGGLERALANKQVRGMKHAKDLGRVIEKRPEFDLLRTSVDEFLKEGGVELGALAKDPGFRVELKAVQRVFKLAPTFESTDALLADGLHSAQRVYRLGESEFVRRYGERPGFTRENARTAWNRAADTHAAVLTIVGDLASFDSGGLPGVLKSSHPDLTKFPNWNNLFQIGDICHCEHCRSALSPAAYFTDLLMYLGDRSSLRAKAGGGFHSVRDILFDRRPDLGYLELNCENALTTLPYVDVVCEVLERAVDATGDSDVELTGLASIPDKTAATKAAVKAALDAKSVTYGSDFTLSQVDPSDPDRWVVHGTEATYLLKKKATANFFAQLLPNTKATSAELRAYPAYVNGEAYKKLREAKYPLAVPLDLFPEGDARRQEQRNRAFSLPFDLFAEEVRAGFQKSNLQRWDLMRTFKGLAAPNNPTDGEIAAEYFGISSDPSIPAPANSTDPTDEKGIILTARSNDAWQQAFWGETNNNDWLTPFDANGNVVENALCNVKYFLRKTGLEYEELLAMLDLPFINPAGDITIQHIDASCDTNKKIIQGLNAAKLDRIHRFLRLWRKLSGWKLWELDLVARCDGIGHKNAAGEWLLDEAFLTNVYYLARLRTRLGTKATLEELCALFDDLNAETHFTKAHEKRADGLYQSLFLNKKLIQPLDPAFEVTAVDVAWPTVEKISGHRTVILAALGVREADLELLAALPRPSDGAPHITDDLTLSNLSFLWRHAWLAKLLKFKAEEWNVVLKLLVIDRIHLLPQDLAHRPRFASPKIALEFVEKTDHLRNAGFTPDQLNWLLAADRSAKAAVKDSDAERFLAGLRKNLQAIQAEYNPGQYDFLTATPPANVDGVTALLSSLLQKLNQDEVGVNAFLKTLRGGVTLETVAEALPASFAFPAAITGAPNHIPIQYDEQAGVLRLSGILTAAQRATLLNDVSLAPVSEQASYRNSIDTLFQQSAQVADNFVSVDVEIALPGGVTLPPDRPSLPVRYNSATQKLSFVGVMTDPERLALKAAGNPATAIDELFLIPRLAIKFFGPEFTAPLKALPSAIDFKAQLPAELAVKISYDAQLGALRFAGLMTSSEKETLDALVPNVLPADVAYHIAVNSLASQPQTIAPPDERIWLTDSDIDAELVANNTLAKRLANAAKKALNYLGKTLAASALVQQSSPQLGLTEALTRHLLDGFAIMPPLAPDPAKTSLLLHLTRVFAGTSGVVDYATLKTTFDGWLWAQRAALPLKKWKITLDELKRLVALTEGAQLLDLTTLPLDDTSRIASLERFLRTSRLLRMWNTLPEEQISLLELLEKLNSGVYAAGTSVTVRGLPAGFAFPAAITGGANPIPIQYDQLTSVLRFTGQMSISQRATLLNDASLAAVKAIAGYRSAIEGLFRSSFAGDVERANGAWRAEDVETLRESLDLVYPGDYLLAENWERVRRAFYFVESLGADVATVQTFASASMGKDHTGDLKSLLRARFGGEAWLVLSAEIQDVLRERKRDALAAYLLAQPEPTDAPTGKWETTNDLYAYYLLDVEMGACQLTSRLVQASGSVQLFVQRCFMGIEPEVRVEADGPNGDSAWRWWKWMRKYRPWEANMEVWLWPENWILPELKRDRSPFFKELEKELLQNEINQYTVEAAFANYLEKLHGVAQLEIAGFYQEDDGDDTILHVFGRTSGAEPHLYYYRRYDYRQWTPWEKVDLDIQGDYLIPVVVNKRLFLFWPVFTEVPDETANETADMPDVKIKKTDGDQTVEDPGVTKVEVKKAAKKLRLQMAVSDYRQEKWSPKRVSKEYDESHDSYRADIIRQHYAFFPVDRSEIDGRVVVKYEGHSVDGAAELSGAFEIAGCAGVPVLVTDPLGNFRHATRPEKASTGLKTVFLKWKERSDRTKYSENDLSLVSELTAHTHGSQLTPVLMQTPWLFRISPPWHLSYLDRLTANGLLAPGLEDLRKRGVPMGTWLPYFYADKKRTFFVLPSLWAGVRDRKPELFGSLRSYYPEIKHGFRALNDQYEGGIRAWAESITLPAPGTPERRQWETDLHEAVPGDDEIAPPFTDAELRDRGVRYLMRFVHSHLGAFSWWLFQFRQFHFLNFYHPFVCDFAKLVHNPVQGIAGLMRRETQLKNSGFSFRASYQPHRVWVVTDIPLTFRLTDIADLGSIASRLTAAADPVSRYVAGELSDGTEQSLANYQATGADPDLRQRLIRDLNKIIRTETLYDAPRFGGVALRLETQELLARSPIFEDLVRLNRLLLEDAYPVEIRRGQGSLPKEIVDFSPDGACSPYNWELFLLGPLFIGNALSKNQRFEEARDWYHFIFNPIGVESKMQGGSAVSKYWITKPFFETTDPAYVQQRIDNVMHMLAGDTNVPGYSDEARKALDGQVEDWRTNPFEPHRIANYRTVAYQKTVVMNYLDNLIAWGDYLFRQDSMESINEATQLYILAAEILGPRPKRVAPKDKPPVETFNELEHQLDAVPNALAEIENLVPAPSGEGGASPESPPLPRLYFCIPHNEKMLGYWDTVADRLYKIRHCTNIEGVVRQLALFEPPIDPGALVKAVAAGVDIGAALADLNAPLPLYRFNVLLQKANEVCSDVKTLGAALLGALEKKDTEALSLLRQGQEIRVLEAVKAVREKQIEEAKESLEALKKNKEMVTIKRNYYQVIKKINTKEQLSLDEQGIAQGHQAAAQSISIGASLLGYMPSLTMGAAGFGGSAFVNVQWGTANIISALQAMSGSEQLMASLASYRATRASTLAGYDRRFKDWKHQERLANKELEQLEKSIAGAELRLAIAEKELENQIIQIDNARSVDEFLRSKYTNEELYRWQVGQISSVFFQSYKLAYDLAKRAERCFRFELGLNDSSFINFGYWDSLRKGLLSGEKLQYDLRRLEAAYLEQNRREFELTKNVSLCLLDPLALMKLRETGRCFFRLPEELFDLDYPGHYFRRIKSVSLTIPCVAGPYTTVSCTLRLIKSSIRATTASSDNRYPRNTDDAGLPSEDIRFIENNIPVNAFATSSGQNDSGVFNLNFRDEQFLPIEGAGAICEFALELFTDLPANNPNPANPDFGAPLRQFDYSTIVDAVLHIKYTAREDAGSFKDGAIKHLRNYFSEDVTSNSWLALDLRRDFGTAWSRFLHPVNPDDGNVFELEMSPALFPQRDAGKTLKINTIVLLARCTDPRNYDVTLTPPLPEPPPSPTPPPPISNTMVLAKSNAYGGLHFDQKDVVGIEIVPTDEPVVWRVKVTSPRSGNMMEAEMKDAILILGYMWE